MSDLRYLQAKAATTPTTDRGEFRALVATWDEDREHDVIVRGAFGNSIDEWVEVGRALPLHWNHQADDIIGQVDPRSMAEMSDGLEVSGKIDLDDELGRKAWKGLKANRLAFSFGFLSTKTRERDDGVREILAIDVYEISVTPSPMNNRTRVLSVKAATAATESDLRARSMRAVRAALAGTAPARASRPAESEDELVEQSRRQYLEQKEKEAAAAIAVERERTRRAADAEQIQRDLLLRSQQAEDPAERSPGLGPNWQPLPSPAAIARAEAEERKVQRRAEERRRERAAEAERRDELERRRREAQQPPTSWSG